MKMSIMLAAVSTAVLMPVFGASSTDATDKDLSSAMTINVASGDTLTWTGTITGSATLTKTGDGNLVFKHDNSSSFSGAIAVEGGSIELGVQGGFGSGAINVSASAVANKTRGVILNAADAVVGNAMAFSGANVSSESCYVLFCSQNATVTGTISATKDFSLGGSAGKVLTIKGNINASGRIVYFTSNGRVNIAEECTITCKNCCTYSTAYATSEIHFYGDGTRHVVSGQFSMKQENIYSEHENALPYTYYYVTCASHTYKTNQRAFDIDLQGHNQAIKYLWWSSGTKMSATCGGAVIRSTGGPATLTLSGNSGTTSESYFALGENVSLVMDRAKFIQPLMIRTHSTYGSIIVTNGTLALSDTISFPNATNIHVYAGAVLSDASTVAGSLAGATNITIEGTGKISFSSSAASPFNARKAVLHVAANAILEIPSGMTVEVKELWVDGERQPDDTYTSGGSYAFLTQAGTLKVSDYDPVTAIWNAESAPNDGVSAAGNWQGGTRPNLSGSFLTVAVSNGTHIAMDTAANFLGLIFDPSIAGFTFDGANTLQIGADGVRIPGDGTAHTWNFFAPLAVNGGGTWTIPSGDTVNITGGMSGSGSVTFNGGAVTMDGNNAFSGGITLDGTTLRLKGTLGVDGDGSTFAQVSSTDTITLDGVDILKPCAWADTTRAIYCTAGSSNRIGAVIKNNPIYPVLPADATLVIDGKMYIDATSWTPGSLVQGTNIWVTAPYVRGLNTMIRPSACTIIYAVPTGSTPAKDWYLTYNTAHSRFDVDNVCDRRKAYQESSSKKAMAIALLSGANSSCDLNGTTQTFNGCSGTQGRVYSETPAALVISPLAMDDYNSTKENWVLYADSTFGAQLQGPVALRFEPSGLLTNAADATTLTIAARAYESTGSLEVTNHTMIVAAGATFKGLSRVKAVEKGVFDLQSATDAFGDELVLELGGTAELKVAANTLMRVRTVIVNGVETHVRPGSYTTEQFKDKLGSAFEGNVTGDGFIRVTGAGTKLLLR